MRWNNLPSEGKGSLRAGACRCRGEVWGSEAETGPARAAGLLGNWQKMSRRFGQCLLIYQGGVFWVGIFFLQPFCLHVSNNHRLWKKEKS